MSPLFRLCSEVRNSEWKIGDTLPCHLLRNCFVVVFAAAVAFGLQARPGEPRGLRCWATHALEKVKPGDPPPAQPQQAIDVAAARNEFEPFQIVLSSSEDLSGIDVELTDLAGPGSSVLPRKNAAIYLERYVRLRRPSSPEGQVGEWPDPLVPRVDGYVGERRNAFPFGLTKGRNQPVWVELYVPAGTAPGLYTGSVRISASGREAAAIAVRLRVWDFELPSTSSLRTSFGFSGTAALKRHRGSYTNDEELYALTRLYGKAALLHRLTICGGSMVPPRFSLEGQSMKIHWSDYDREVGPFLDGTVLDGDGRLPGARATSAELRTSGAADTDAEKILYWREWRRHFKEKGWYDRLYHYVWDEPKQADFPKVIALARLAQRADPELPNLVTVPYHPDLARFIQIWTPLINCFEIKPGFEPFCATTVPRSQYDGELRRGKRLWWYQSCASHGCNPAPNVTGGYFVGWPTYVVDAPAISNRIMQWIGWKYGVEGELYFSVNDSYGHGDPWDEIYLHGGNGDGTLFYPGKPERVGGTRDIPIESLRLKLIREGLEDYEYLRLAERRDPRIADDAIRKIVKTTFSWERRPEVLYAVRRSLGDRLDGMRP